jgi:hypothetical protein
MRSRPTISEKPFLLKPYHFKAHCYLYVCTCFNIKQFLSFPNVYLYAS